MQADEIVRQIREGAKPRQVVAGARANPATMKRFEGTEGYEAGAVQARIGGVPLVPDSSLADGEVALYDGQGELLQTLKLDE